MFESRCQGLCINCSKSKECSFMRGREGEIYFCEEFETQSGKKVITAYQDKIFSEVKRDTEVKDKEYCGICLNCDLRKGCSERFTKGDISFCENHC